MEAINMDQVKQVIDQISKDPNHMAKLMSEVGPEVMNSTSGMSDLDNIRDKVAKEMQERNINVAELRKLIKKNKKNSVKKVVKNFKCVQVTESRQVKTRELDIFAIDVEKNSQIVKLIKCEKYATTQCFKLNALNKEKRYIAFYDDTLESVNKLATKILGFPVGGSIILVCHDDEDFEDLTEEEVNSLIEKL
jgi:hypothetical protein